MPILYLRKLTGRERTLTANRHLARYLAFIAGAVNAGGFLAVRQYTSHMSGVLSSVAENTALGEFPPAFAGFMALLAFSCGAASTALLVRWARARRLQSEYALPLALEATLMLLFGLNGSASTQHEVFGNILLLCFTMGLQNAIVTKLSGAVIRTTHITGMVTDIGIKLGRMAFAVLERKPVSESVDVGQLTLLLSLIALFFVGGVVGALGFRRLGFIFSVPLAAMLLCLAFVPLVDDLRSNWMVQ